MINQPIPRVRTRYETLDALRGLACLMVVTYHATMVYQARGTHATETVTAAIAEWLVRQTHAFNAGVALFFVISGYCIAAAADGSRARDRSVSTYFRRRLWRIYPPLWAILLLSVLFFGFDYWPVRGLLSDEPWAQLRPWWYSPSQWFGNVTLTESWRSHLFGSPRGHFPGQAWTLCYEEQFYAVTGAALAFRPAWFYRAMTGVTVGTLVLLLAAAPMVDGFFFDGSWLLFAAGVGVYYRLQRATAVEAKVLDAVLVTAIPVSWWLSIPVAGATTAFVVAAVLPRLHRFDGRVVSSAALTPLFFSGRMCYSLYLVHQIPVKAVSSALFRGGVDGPVGTLVLTIPASLLVSLCLGWLFHQGVERHFLNAPLSQPLNLRHAPV